MTTRRGADAVFAGSLTRSQLRGSRVQRLRDPARMVRTVRAALDRHR